MPAATMTSKGQVTVPQAVRAALGLHAGTKIDFGPGPVVSRCATAHGGLRFEKAGLPDG